MPHNKKALEIFNKLAEAYEKKYMDVDLYAKSLDFLCTQLTKDGAMVLDIACGPGNVAKYLLNKRPDLQLLGTDLSENMVAIAKKNNPEASFQVLDGRKIDSLEKQFDGIVCSFLLPYLSMPEMEKLLKNMASKLPTNGILYLSTIEGENENSILRKAITGDEIFMHYYSEKILIQKLEELQFEILGLERLSYLLPDVSNTVDVILVAKMKS
jgi:ubiquinone/menaquinone biosynthesis C-methylase UbiE